MMTTIQLGEPELLLRVCIPWRIVPAVRVAGAKFSPTAKRYHDDQRQIRQLVALWGKGPLCPAQGPARQGKRPQKLTMPDYRVRLGVVVFVPPTKKTGLMSQAIGDWDNYYKAALDALVYGGFLSEDNAAFVAGPGLTLIETAPLDLGGEFKWVESGIYLGDTAQTWITVTREVLK